jgi:hypothetical protein
MIATVFGFVTALVMAVLGTQWYIAQRRLLEANESSPRPAQPADAPPLVSLDVAEQLMQATPVVPSDVTSEAETWVEPDDASEPLEVAAREPEEPEVVAEPAQPDALPVQEEAGTEEPRVKPEVEEPPDRSEMAAVAEFSGYCNRCRERRSIVEHTLSRTASGRPSVRGECPECGAGMFVFISEEEWDAQQS